MYSKQTLALLAATISAANAAIYQGFNYGAETDFPTAFANAKALVGTSGAFTSARLYTSIQPNSATDPTSAIPAAIAADVSLLLGVWCSAGQASVDNEITAIKNAIAQYGTAFTSRVVGISVGSEDLYRTSVTGIINKSGVGAYPDQIVSYINQVRAAIQGTTLSGAPIGHVDTWTDFVNGSNSAVIDAVDFLGMDAYPYFQTTQNNAIDQDADLFFSAYQQTVAAAGGKPVWVTETGFPVSGPAAGAAVPSLANAETYWKAVACKLLGNTNTWWYTLNDNGASPSFGVTTGSDTPLYDLSCAASSSSSSSSSSVASSTSSSAAVVVGTSSSASASASSAVSSAVSSASSAAQSSAMAASTGTSSPNSASAAVSASSISAAISSSAASLSAKESTATPSNLIVSVTNSAVPTGQVGGGSPGAASSKVGDSSVASIATASSSLYSSILASASSAAAASPTASPSSVVPVASASGMSTSVASGSSTGSKTSSTSPASYTGGASTATMGSTGGIVAAIFALLAVF